MMLVSGVATAAKMVAAMVRCGDEEEGGKGDGSGGGVLVVAAGGMAAATMVGTEGEVAARGIWDRIKRVIKIVFGFSRKTSRKSFLETAAVVVVIGGWPALGRRGGNMKTTNVVESEFHTNVTMADNRTMAQMLQAPIEGYEDAIVVPQINVTSTFRHLEVPNTTIKLLLFPFSLEGEAQIWLDREPPRSILTWEDLVSKFINQFFPPSKTTYLRNEITNFLQKPNETFNETWEHFKDLLCQCPHHGFSELHQLDTFYNALNPNDQDALDSAAGGNFLDKIPRECLSIIESMSKVRYSRSRVTDVRGILKSSSYFFSLKFFRSSADCCIPRG
nr:reverse transcriptase domain-containing protein [Tanacetum cinerariifolium]